MSLAVIDASVITAFYAMESDDPRRHAGRRAPVRRRRPFAPAHLDAEVVSARMWQLRDSITAYDAAYVALAELLGAPLVTADTTLAGAAGTSCAFDVIR